MKLICLITFCCFTYLFSFSQNTSTYFSNDSISYHLFRTKKPMASGKNGYVLFYYVEIDMPKNIKDSLLKMKSSFWLEKLRSGESDWATILVLYYIFERDALPIAIAEKKRAYRISLKESEIKYWTGHIQEVRR